MKISINLSPVPPQQLVAAGKLAEEVGFDGVNIGEHIAIPTHLSTPYPGKIGYSAMSPLLETYVALGALAAVTSRVRLGTGISILPIRHPLQTARAIATVDGLSNGRLDLAIGTGSIVDEFEAMGSDYATRGERMEEMVQIFDLLWSQEKPSFEGRYYRFPEIGFEPKPVQKPRPPVFIGAFGPAGLRRAARIADGWYGAAENPEQAKLVIDTVDAMLKEYGRDPAGFRYTLIHGLGMPVLPTLDERKAYEDLGVDMIVVSVIDLTPGNVMDKIESAADFLRL